ncbi:MAG: hypothetical protein GY909_00290 [Oligoflexia bacterium]|nr:hypothetical protein [Oligoflexia bacterium]
MNTICRLNISPYQSNNFRTQESSLFESLGYRYQFETPENAQILISNTHTEFEKLGDDVLKNCKLIIHPNSGYDNISLEFVEKMNEAGVSILSGNSIRSNAVATYILSSFFEYFASVPAKETWQDGRSWPRVKMEELNILILGQGHIGTKVEQSLRPVVGEVHVYDPFKNMTRLDNELLAKVDVIIPACGLNATSEKIINEKFLAELKDEVLIINGARGKLIDQTALIKFLKAKPQSFAYLDVFEKEPCDFAIFKGLKNVALTSHIAGVFATIDQTILDFEKEVITDFKELSSDEFQSKYHSLILQNKIKETETGKILI